MKPIMKLLSMFGDGIVSIIKGIFGIIKWIANGIVNIILGTVRLIKNMIRASIKAFRSIFIVPFLPKYKVIFSMYQVIPGLPVNKSDSVHDFEKGNGSKAIHFYNNVVKTTANNKIMPAEVLLIKRKKIVATQQFGPVNEIKRLNLVA